MLCEPLDEPAEERWAQQGSTQWSWKLRGGPAGGGFSTVGDLHRFIRALAGDKHLDRATRDILW